MTEARTGFQSEFAFRTLFNRFSFLSVKKFPIARESELAEGQTIQFKCIRAGKYVKGFVARFGGEVVGYENVCRHLPVGLDDGEGEFFSRDGNHFICQAHGALYDPLSGLCVRGPCEGASLKKLKLEIEDGVIWLGQSSNRIK